MGEQITHLVDGLTKIAQIHNISREDQQAENVPKMLLAIVRLDARVVLVKLADRLHNMRTLPVLRAPKSKAYRLMFWRRHAAAAPPVYNSTNINSPFPQKDHLAQYTAEPHAQLLRHYGCTSEEVVPPEVSMRRLVCVFVAVLAISSARADALTIRDVVELTRAGLGDEVLLALIEVDPSVFPIDTETLKYLKEAGVSQRVIVAMVRSARTPPPPRSVPDPFISQVAPQAPEPQVVVIDHHDPERVREVPVAVPIFTFPSCSVRGSRVMSITSIETITFRTPRTGGTGRTLVETDHHQRRTQPVYWGTSGTLRPDAWKPK